MDERYSDYKQDYGKYNYGKKSYENSYEQDSYGKDRDYDKSKDNNVSLKKLKCNNINANLNNIDASFGSPVDSNVEDNGANGEALAAQSDNGLTNGDRSFVDRENNFAFVCINNNNNTIVETETPIPPVDECAEDVEACFEEFLPEGQFEELLAALNSPIGVTVEINGQEITLRSFADICSALEGVTNEQLGEAIVNIISAAIGEPVMLNIDLLFCIEEALGIPVP